VTTGRVNASQALAANSETNLEERVISERFDFKGVSM
jgi:hypothetical protein